MSKEQESTTRKAPKKAALGRGLGTLLGSLDDDGPEEEIKLPKEGFAAKTDPALSHGFEERKTAPVAAPQTPDHLRIWNISIDKIVANKEQPRKVFEGEALKELSLSIKEQGVLQPIVVRKLDNGNFEIIAGERRWRASQQAGRHEIPAIVRETTNQKALELALIENIQRSDLNPVEEAEAYSFLMNEYGLTQQDVADKVSKERATIANLLRLLQLTPEVREMVSKGDLSLGLGKVLLSVTDPKLQRKLARKAVKNSLSVRAVEKIVQKFKQEGSKALELEELDVSKKLIEGLSKELQKLFGTRVNIDYKNGKGKLSIQYYTDDQLNQIVDKMKKAWEV